MAHSHGRMAAPGTGERGWLEETMAGGDDGWKRSQLSELSQIFVQALAGTFKISE